MFRIVVRSLRSVLRGILKLFNFGRHRRVIMLVIALTVALPLLFNWIGPAIRSGITHDPDSNSANVPVVLSAVTNAAPTAQAAPQVSLEPLPEGSVPTTNNPAVDCAGYFGRSWHTRIEAGIKAYTSFPSGLTKVSTTQDLAGLKPFVAPQFYADTAKSWNATTVPTWITTTSEVAHCILGERYSQIQLITVNVVTRFADTLGDPAQSDYRPLDVFVVYLNGTYVIALICDQGSCPLKPPRSGT